MLPWYDVPVTEAPKDEELAELFPGFEGFELDMATLAEKPAEDLIRLLRRIPETYGNWIEEQESSLSAGGRSDLDAHRGAAELALERAEAVRKRLDEGVDVLEGDAAALKAFRFANRAMRLQRLRSVFALRRRRGENASFDQVAATEPAEWFPFQLAFILLNVATVAKLDHPRRINEVASYADLLWFPTGGGKTEAYLGVAAFAIAMRRLQGRVDGFEGDGGVTVIMRYTLRLLTLQQFQRAATLVCAMEHLRTEENDFEGTPWGREPFRIGLWVGAKATPNTTASANEWVNVQRGSNKWTAGAGSSSPLQLTNCPWCGHALKPDDVRVELYGGGRGRTFLHCPDRHCAFNRRNSPDEGIPVVTVDEEIYRLLPTFLLATVDKFAQMPWRGDVQALFGRVVARCERHGWLGTERACEGVHKKRGSLPASRRSDPPPSGFRPPDLIIQDELHLISGPLGTLVGLYETAVDELCTWEANGVKVRPKVIASTATTRRAPEQVNRLFCRQVEIFPPPGLDADDNFFSRQRRPSDTPGRRYLGVCAPGRSRPAVLIRVYVAVLAAAEWLWRNVDEADRHFVDPYMTLLGYFNSLRELGGMKRLVDDDVSTRAFRVERADRPGMAQRRMFPETTVQELTSRIRSSQIPEILDRLEVSFVDAPQRGWSYRKAPRCRSRHQHGVGRRRRAAARSHGRIGSAEGHGGVHPGLEPRRPKRGTTRSRRHGPQLGTASRSQPLRAVRAVPRRILPVRRGTDRDSIRSARTRSWPHRCCRVAGSSRCDRSQSQPRGGRGQRSRPVPGHHSDHRRSGPKLIRRPRTRGGEVGPVRRTSRRGQVGRMGRSSRNTEPQARLPGGVACRRRHGSTVRGGREQALGRVYRADIHARGRARRGSRHRQRRNRRIARVDVHAPRRPFGGRMTPLRPIRVGSVRPSQLMWSYGVGAMIDLPRLSVMVEGLDHWNTDHARVISEDRLLAAVRRELGPQVARLHEPPLPEEEVYGLPEGDPKYRIGVPVTVFPTWLRCPRCGLLSDAYSGVFQFEGSNRRPDQAGFVHRGCSKQGRGRPPACIPARFIVACQAGHVDDFPWREFVHRGRTNCSGTLRFYEKGSSLETANLFVACDLGRGFGDSDEGEPEHPGAADGCGARPRSLVDAFGARASGSLPVCRGRHPHLRKADGDCGRQLRTILLGSSNSWFPKAISALSIPTGETKLEQAIAEKAQLFGNMEDLSDVKFARRTNQLGGATRFSDEEIWEAIQKQRADGDGDGGAEDMKSAEWRVLSDPSGAPESTDFEVTLGAVPQGFDGLLMPTVLVERIREVNALVGFTRLEAPEDLLAGHDDLDYAPLSLNRPRWVPSNEVRGEGLLLQFDPSALTEWESRPAVLQHLAALEQANRAWRAARQLPEDRGFPGNRHVLIHTFSHLLMRELALECGYSGASIRERVYADVSAEESMAGVLIYTAAPDSEGTLGGLVRLGESDTMGRLVRQALDHARLCASDPLCAEHDPRPDRTLHAAACHACTFAPETSCEFGNRFLDRATVVHTLTTSDVSFFDR